MTVTTSATIYGRDIDKSVFQLHGEDSTGKIVVQKRLARSQLEAFLGKLAPAVIGIEACGTSHFWARQIAALGHTVRLIPAAYVKAFVKRNKNDARDAAAICVAAGRPDMRGVPVKTIDQPAASSIRAIFWSGSIRNSPTACAGRWPNGALWPRKDAAVLPPCGKS